MNVSIFDLFKIGVGPSSSHTVGPMKAANRFFDKIVYNGLLDRVTRVEVVFYGSLALTGKGHGTFYATIFGLAGHQPETIDTLKLRAMWQEIRQSKSLLFGGKKRIEFIKKRDLIIKKKEVLPYHTNGMTFRAFDGDELLREKSYYSIGGGFVVGENAAKDDSLISNREPAKYHFGSAQQLLELCERENKNIHEIVLENERCWYSDEEIDNQLLAIWDTMQQCVKNGLRKSGKIPGMGIKRRAKLMHKDLLSRPESALNDPLTILDWVNLYALAVNEENASYGRVVTAPTNGAAGIIPAVLHYYKNFKGSFSFEGVKRFLLTAGAIGVLYKSNASISGAEVGCQGEVGVACSMAAAGLTDVLGGTAKQIENAAEIGMEHNLGLTCDPIGGLVQIPCIERNAMASIKAINATRMALRGTGEHYVSLDNVMKTMMETGKDMQSKYKETAQGGLAVCVTEC